MEKMKKITAVLLTLVMALCVFTACGDPVADEFEKFLNTDMVDVNANYEKLKTEMGKWSDFNTYDEIKTSINDVLLPLINDSIEKVNAISAETEEVKALKTKYIAVMDKYKEAYETMVVGCDTDDDSKFDEANNQIDEGIKLLDEYNKALEDLATEKGMEIEY